MSLKDEVIKIINADSYYSKYVDFIEKKGNNWRAKCPFHDEKDGSFFVDPATGKWICMGACQEGGDIFKFQMKYHGQDFKTALETIAKELNIEIPERSETRSKGSKSKKSKYPERTKEAINRMHEDLTEKQRTFLASRGISGEIISEHKIGNHKGFIVFPVMRGENVHTYKFYRKNDDGSKDIKQIPKVSLGHDPMWLFPEPRNEKEIYLFEGEPDALTAISMGINGTTVTLGAGNFRDELLKFFKGKKVFICYDIDSSGKLGAKKVARKIATVAKETRIISLPLDPQKHPKGDFTDYVITEKKTLKKFLALRKDASFEVSVPPEVQVIEDDGSYYSAHPGKGDSIVYKKITNFTVRLMCRYIKTDEMVREVRLVSRDTRNKSDPRILNSDQMASVQGFKSFCYSCGDFIYEGSAKDLSDIFYLISAQDPDAKTVRQVHQIGYIKSENIWLFENIAIKNGKDILPDERGIFWNGKKGYSFVPIDSSGEDEIKHLPNLILKDSEDEADILPILSKVLVDNVGSLDVLFGLSFTVGSIYFSDILADSRLGSYPLLFVYGSLKSGKTEYVSFLMKMFGLDKSDGDSLPATTSSVPISRKLAYFSNIPVWWDEYRDNLPRLNSITGVLRGAFDGSGRSKGVKDQYGIHKEPIRAPVIISGEHIPTDEALRSRMIPIRMKQAGKDISMHPRVIEMSNRSSNSIYRIIKDKTKETTKELIDRILYYKKEISDNSKKYLDERILKSYATMLGCYNMFVDPNDAVFPDYIIHGDGIISIDKEEFDSQDPFRTQLLDDFIDGVQVIIETGGLKGISWYELDQGSGKVYIWLVPLYEEYAKRYRQIKGDAASPMATIRNHFKDMSCFESLNTPKKIKSVHGTTSTNKKCIVLSLDRLPRKMFGWFGGET